MLNIMLDTATIKNLNNGNDPTLFIVPDVLNVKGITQYQLWVSQASIWEMMSEGIPFKWSFQKLSQLKIAFISEAAFINFNAYSNSASVFEQIIKAHSSSEKFEYWPVFHDELTSTPETALNRALSIFN